MLALGVVLLVVGVADLVASGIDGDPVPRLRAGLATALGAGLAAAVALGVRDAWLVGAVAAVTSAAWLVARDRAADREDVNVAAEAQRADALRALVVLVSGVAVAVAVDVLVGPDVAGPLAEAVRGAEREPAAALLVAGGLAAQVATGNAVVRLVLRVAGPGPAAPSTARLRAGRVVGVLERVLVFGTLAAGQAGLAGGVVAAKGLLRYPEVAEAAKATAHDPPSDPEPLTEYLLVGTLTSVVVAAFPALVL